MCRLPLLKPVDAISTAKWRLMQKAAILLLILLGIQVLNQFLNATGGAQEKLFLPDSPTTRFLVGIYQ